MLHYNWAAEKYGLKHRNKIVPADPGVVLSYFLRINAVSF